MIRPFTSMRTLALAVSLLTATAALAQSEPATEMTVVIGETGYLAINAPKPFTGPDNLIVCSANATNNANTTDIKYTPYRADTIVAMATTYVLVGQPGTYKLTFKESATLKGSAILSWTTESSYTDTRNQEKPELRRRVYKFINTMEKVGFQRDEKYADVLYQKCDFADGEHLYISLPSNVIDKVAAASGKTNRDDLDFIVWHGPTPADAATAGISTVKSDGRSVVDGAVYNLQGQRLTHPQKGLNIVNGKKFIVK